MRRLASVAALALLAASAAGAIELTPQELAGKRLYREGVGASGASVAARVGIDASPIPGSAVPCANCHGADGLGRPEGAVVPSVITWSELTKPYGHLHERGRRHPPFDVEHLGRAVTEGVDPAGNRLDRTMPRYALGREDIDNLAAYLKRLEHDADRGVHADRVRVGTLLPLAGPLGETGRQVQRVLAAYFDELNEAGGLYGRRVELVEVEHGRDRAETLARAKSLVAAGDVVALVAPIVPGADEELARLADAQRLPVVAPLGASDAAGPARYTFHVQSGVREQVRTLVAYAAGAFTIAGRPVTVIVPDDPARARLADALAAQCEEERCGRVVMHRHAPGAFDADAALTAHANGGAPVVFFLGDDADLAAFLRAADARGAYTHVLVPGPLGARAAAQAPAGFDGRILLAYPNAPGAALTPGNALQALRARHALPDTALAAQASAYAAAALLTEGLRRSGKDVSREKLVGALESLRSFDVAATPPVSFGPGRRIGALGGYVVALDRGRGGFRPVSPWMPLE
jgi:ABC-type branched-subunit amino acid transport system substrate-binding protein